MQNGVLADEVGRVRAPQEIDSRWSEVRDFVCHLDGAAVQTNCLPCCDRIDWSKCRERSKLWRRFFHRPAQRPQFAQTWILLTAKDARLAGGKPVIPATAPIIVEIGVDRISLRLNAR